MTRTLILALAASTLFVGSASAQSVRVTVTGKTTTQLHADISKAAEKVCRQAVVGASFPIDMYRSCYNHAVRDAVTKAGDPALASAAGVKLAQR